MAKILVVDDKPLNRSVMTTLLGYRGHRLLEASTGLEALDKVRHEAPELVITDILMPAMDGYEFVRRLRGLEELAQPKVIFYSATYLKEEAQALARACGVSSVICKPAEPEEILRVVEEALALRPGEQAPLPSDEQSVELAVKVFSNKLYEKIQETEELNLTLERRVAERTAELHRINRFLQQQIAERKKAEEQAAQTREEQLRLKSEFLSHVSHELRSPLSVAYQFTTILLDGLTGPLSPDQREYLEIALRNLDQLKGMIGDLLEASRAEAGKLSVRRSAISVSSVIRDVVKSQSAFAAEKGIALQVDAAPDIPSVYADASRISQVLTNLLDNALKFSPPNTGISLRARPFEADPNFICVSVADCGCGIKPQEAERVFDRLFQGENTMQSSRRGLGLGLHICKELISLHGGSIWVDTIYGKGSTFQFTLPIFARKSLIGPLLTQDGHLVPSLALVTIKVSSPATGQGGRDREKALYRVQQILERCILPDLDVLLPLESSERLDLFIVVARTDQRGAQVLIKRIREQLAHCEALNDCGIECSVDGEAIELGNLGADLPLGECVDFVDQCVQERIARTTTGARADEQQQNPSD
jgi:signal transduction histidine kinase